jgi:hypothetical protein
MQPSSRRDTVKNNFATSIKGDFIVIIMGFRKNLYVVCCVYMYYNIMKQQIMISFF